MRRLLLFPAMAAITCAAQAEEPARANYLLACRGCHLEDGRGVPPEVPSLRNALGQFAATADGRAYLVRVPGVAQSRLNDQDLADVINWILTRWNSESLPRSFTPYSASEVARARSRGLADPKTYRAGLVEALLPQ